MCVIETCQECADICSCGCPDCEIPFCREHWIHLRDLTPEEVESMKCFKPIEEN
jgi:hypothetical protein